jgi:hypothetical protein
MKNIIKLLLLISVSTAFWACTNQDIVVRYPSSTPKIDTALVAESQITYGDSIHIKVVVSDKIAPLSTLVLRVVCNGDIVNSETIRTKGNSASINRTYRVPFVANRPDNEPIKIYLTETNVSGDKKDSIVSTTIAHRPAYTDLWMVPDGGKGIKMTLIDPVNLIYHVSGLTFGTTLAFRIASKVKTGFNKEDYTGLVWGAVGTGIGLIDITGKSFSITDATLVGISEFTFDAMKFTATVGGKLLLPVTTLDVNADLISNPSSLLGTTAALFRGGNVYFGQGVEVTFTGITGNLANSISPDYFQVTGTNKAIFLGTTGLYKAYFYTPTGYLYIEPQPTAVYPDVLWICGVGFGRPQSPYTTTASWNWNTPLDYAPCRQISSGVYQVTVYCENTATTSTTSAIGTLNFKFFDFRGWNNGEEKSTDYTVSAPLAPSSEAGNVGNTVGLSSNPFSGVYRITLNKNDKTISAVKVN